MPTYDYVCGRGHITEARRGYEETCIPCGVCGEPAERVATYADQYTITESGGSGIRRQTKKEG